MKRIRIAPLDNFPVLGFFVVVPIFFVVPIIFVVFILSVPISQRKLSSPLLNRWLEQLSVTKLTKLTEPAQTGLLIKSQG